MESAGQGEIDVRRTGEDWIVLQGGRWPRLKDSICGEGRHPQSHASCLHFPLLIHPVPPMLSKIDVIHGPEGRIMEMHKICGW